MIDPELRLDFLGYKVPGNLSSGLKKLASKAETAGLANDGSFWEIISSNIKLIVYTIVLERCPKPATALSQCVEGGIVHCAFRCINNLDHQSKTFQDTIVKGLNIITPYTTYGDVFKALKGPMGDWYPQELFKIAGRHGRDGREISKTYKVASERDWMAFEGRKDIEVNMCSNLKVCGWNSPLPMCSPSISII